MNPATPVTIQTLGTERNRSRRRRYGADNILLLGLPRGKRAPAADNKPYQTRDQPHRRYR